jgi:hypothetical protein
MVRGTGDTPDTPNARRERQLERPGFGVTASEVFLAALR